MKFKKIDFEAKSIYWWLSSSCEIALGLMLLDLTDDKSTLVQVIAWCCQATSQYLSQCWPRFMSPYGVTRQHVLTHCGFVNPHGIMDFDQHWFRQWFGCCLTAPSHYLNLCWLIVYKIFRNMSLSIFSIYALDMDPLISIIKMNLILFKGVLLFQGVMICYHAMV